MTLEQEIYSCGCWHISNGSTNGPDRLMEYVCGNHYAERMKRRYPNITYDHHGDVLLVGGTAFTHYKNGLRLG